MVKIIKKSKKEQKAIITRIEKSIKEKEKKKAKKQKKVFNPIPCHLIKIYN